MDKAPADAREALRDRMLKILRCWSDEERSMALELLAGAELARRNANAIAGRVERVDVVIDAAVAIVPTSDERYSGYEWAAFRELVDAWVTLGGIETLARFCGVSPATVEQWELGVSDPDVAMRDAARDWMLERVRAKDGRIHATVTDPTVALRLKHDHRGISMGYRVAIEPTPTTPWQPSVGDLVERSGVYSGHPRRGQIGTVVRNQGGGRLPWVVRWPDGCETGHDARELRPAVPK